MDDYLLDDNISFKSNLADEESLIFNEDLISEKISEKPRFKKNKFKKRFTQPCQTFVFQKKTKTKKITKSKKKFRYFNKCYRK